MEVFLASENPQCKEALAFQKPLPPSLLCEYEPRFLQSSFWAQFKSAQGWVPLRLWGEEPVSFIVSVLLRKISIPLLGTYTLAYVPMGVDFNDKESELLKDPKKYGDFLSTFSYNIRKFLPSKTLCIRYDIPVDLLSLEEKAHYIQQFSCKKSSQDIQPPDTVILSLDKTEEELLAHMKSKWRYNIHLAEKKGVKIRRGTSADIDIFYNLYETTAKRDGIAIHSKEYYKSLLESGESAVNKEKSGEGNKIPEVRIYIAAYEDVPLASIITLFSKREAVYLYGASSNEHRNLMPTYLLQWQAICDAKKYGSRVYDFYGMPPTDDPSHPMHGLYRFKTGFGGTIVHRPGSFDFPLSKVYGLYIAAEKLRSVWYKKIKKMLAGR